MPAFFDINSFGIFDIIQALADGKSLNFDMSLRDEMIK